MSVQRLLIGRYWSIYSKVMIFTAFLCLAMLGLDLRQTWMARDARLQEAVTETDNLVHSVAQHVQDVFETTDGELKGMRQSLGIEGRDPVALLHLEQRMRARLANQRLFHGLSLLDEHGDPIVTTLDVGIFDRLHMPNYADRAFFRYHREHDDDVAFVGPPVRTKDDEDWVITLSRRFNYPDGRFAGTVTASISINLFRRFFETFNLGEKGGFALEDGQGMLILRLPFDVRYIGRDVSHGDFYRQVPRDAEAGSLEFTSGFDGGPRRLGSFRRVPGFNLITVAAFNKDEVLAGWWRGTKVHLIWLAIIGGFVVILGYRLVVQIRDRVAAEAVAHKLQFEAGQHHILEAERRVYERELEKTNAELEQLAGDLTRARDEAEQASRAKSRFLAGMSHELRTPLNGILGYARLLQMEGGLNVVQSERLGAMLEAGTHLLEMIHCVLDLSEIESGRVELQSTDVDMRRLAGACLDLVRPSAEEKGLALSLSIQPGVPLRVRTDPTRLRQILLNLLGNAVKFTIRGGVQMRIGGGANDGMLRFEVIDTGPGVAAQQRHRLFQDFQRLDTEATRVIEGAGLGLFLSAQLTALMGGLVSYEDNPTGGSVFRLELPLMAGAIAMLLPATAVAGGVAEAGAVPASLRALHVLVVDDVLLNRDIASSFLRLSGHQTTCVEGGAEAVVAAKATDFDVVLMDVRMPEIDGLEATRRIRALEGRRGMVPIVALTAQAFKEQIEACRVAGMDNHLAKPFDPETLLAAVMHAAAMGVDRDKQRIALSAGDAVVSAAIILATEAELPICDVKVFEDTVRFLAPKAVASYMQTIVEGGEALLRALREPNALTGSGDELAGAAHSLTGSAGMFGFTRVADLGRRFERAVQSGAAETPALSDDLGAAIEASLKAIRDRKRVAMQVG
jgi:signal transduction histidine kinase/CheY-like chemotaxis protein/HPt (histidine-containing phosphotransfer) domain-containing protein